MENLHRLLRRQVHRALEDPQSLPNDGRELLGLVSDAYEQFDEDHALLEHSLEQMSKELLEANSDTHAAFERVITSSIDSIFACDASFNITVWNPGMELITGVTREDAVDRPLLDVFPRLDETGDHDALQQALATEMTIAKESTYALGDGDQPVFFEIHFSPLRNETGERVGGVAFFRNITERKLAEQALKDLSIRDPLTLRKQIEAAEAHGLDRVFINVDFKLLEHMGHRRKPADAEVILEISEKEALPDIEHHLAVTQEWKAEGFKFAFDDFGVGFISLPFLADLEPDYIKLDRLTVLQAVASEEFRDFLNHVVQALRHYAPRGIVAEGIESEEELAVAEKMGIHLVQGHLFGKPEPIDLIERGSIDRLSRRVGGPPLHRGGRHDGLSGDPGTPPH